MSDFTPTPSQLAAANNVRYSQSGYHMTHPGQIMGCEPTRTLAWQRDRLANAMRTILVCPLPQIQEQGNPIAYLRDIAEESLRIVGMEPTP